MATEIEMKLRAPDTETLQQALKDPELTQFMRDDPVTVHMKSTYYDTADGLLREKQWTLRLRQEGNVRIAAMKTVSEKSSAGMFTRGEWQCSCSDIGEALARLVDQGAPRELAGCLAGKDLIPICTAEFDRQSSYLYLEDGVVIELAGDVGHLFAGGKEEPIIELELELLFGSASALPPLCSRLAEDYGLVNETSSKYERALSLMEAARAENAD